MKKIYIQPSAEFEEIEELDSLLTNSPYAPKGEDTGEMKDGTDPTVNPGESGGDTSDDDLLGGF